MSIYRVVFRERIDGPEMSFEELVAADCRDQYPSATVGEIEEAPMGVRLTVHGERFTVPWASVRYAVEKGPTEAEVEQAAKEWGAGFDERHPAESVVEFPTIEGAKAATRGEGRGTPGAHPERHQKPCPVCVGVQEEAAKSGQASTPVPPNNRRRTSHLCVDHDTPANRKAFKKAAK